MTRTSEDEARFKHIEATFRTHLEPDQYGVIRLDGRAFHSYCRGLAKPNDDQFITDMDAVAVALAQQIDGARLVYVQCDEISIVMTSWTARVESPPARTDFMFGGNIQKLVSISAAIASVTMNTRRLGVHTDRVALFDSRAFSLPARQDVIDYLGWRQRDAGVNALTMHAGAHFSHKQLHGLTSAERRDKLIAAGIDPKSTPEGFRMGRVVTLKEQPGVTTFTRKGYTEPETVEFTRTVYGTSPAPRFLSDDSIIPVGLPLRDLRARTA